MHQLSDKLKYCYLIVFILFFISCAPEINYKILSFVFDGVPEPLSQQMANIEDSTSDGAVNKALITQQKEAKPIIYVHLPYKDRACGSCHDKQKMGMLTESVPGLCFDCHNNMKDEYNVLHGPVAGGYCMSCHSPHTSKKENLIKITETTVCFHCHQEKQIQDNKVHHSIRGEKCLDCHDVHGGESKTGLRPHTCYRCHEDFNETKKYLHGPVQGEYCSVCHSSHLTTSKYQTRKQVPELCFMCHNEAYLASKENHMILDFYLCLKCHNPHGGSNRQFLAKENE